LSKDKDALSLVENNSDRLDCAVLDINLRNERVYPVADVLVARGVPFIFNFRIRRGWYTKYLRLRTAMREAGRQRTAYRVALEHRAAEIKRAAGFGADQHAGRHRARLPWRLGG
jgi:hypothetical protein